jgi:drug/metabolite transporter (DMT)-like permease
MSDNINGNVCGSIMLFVAAFIWGTAFVAQSVGMDYVGPFTFNMARSVLGGTVLLPVIAVMQHYRKKTCSRRK